MRSVVAFYLKVSDKQLRKVSADSSFLTTLMEIKRRILQRNNVIFLLPLAGVRVKFVFIAVF